jgi:hypothetical protein
MPSAHRPRPTGRDQGGLPARQLRRPGFAAALAHHRPAEPRRHDQPELLVLWTTELNELMDGTGRSNPLGRRPRSTARGSGSTSRVAHRPGPVRPGRAPPRRLGPARSSRSATTSTGRLLGRDYAPSDPSHQVVYGLDVAGRHRRPEDRSLRRRRRARREAPARAIAGATSLRRTRRSLRLPAGAGVGRGRTSVPPPPDGGRPTFGVPRDIQLHHRGEWRRSRRLPLLFALPLAPAGAARTREVERRSCPS